VLGIHLRRTGSTQSRLRVYLLFNAENDVAQAVLPSGAWRAVLDTSCMDGVPASSDLGAPAAGHRLRIAVAAESVLMLVQGEDL
jgi:hypothetical protein